MRFPAVLITAGEPGMKGSVPSSVLVLLCVLLCCAFAARSTWFCLRPGRRCARDSRTRECHAVLFTILLFLRARHYSFERGASRKTRSSSSPAVRQCQSPALPSADTLHFPRLPRLHPRDAVDLVELTDFRISTIRANPVLGISRVTRRCEPARW